MLEKLLAEIRKGGTLEVCALAENLGSSPQMVEAMLEHLRRSGLLRSYQACAEACSGCSLKGDCQDTHPKSAVRLWQG